MRRMESDALDGCRICGILRRDADLDVYGRWCVDRDGCSRRWLERRKSSPHRLAFRPPPEPTFGSCLPTAGPEGFSRGLSSRPPFGSQSSVPGFLLRCPVRGERKHTEDAEGPKDARFVVVGKSEIFFFTPRYRTLEPRLDRVGRTNATGGGSWPRMGRRPVRPAPSGREPRLETWRAFEGFNPSAVRLRGPVRAAARAGRPGRALR
jgi:hypothetical protein